ncbi:hypothetical protein AVEN_112190-1 [Araneus ventricosus]|uniref:Uncharacterized protein n=1 Tax=Araneus ventricosus TaxID=182803 RepID=A0A4Y2FZ82_ARAVE|nr:hypothetical protein AVEN_112190-1 [Araneus ventricosus]
MDSSAPFPLLVGDMNGRPFISHVSPKGPFKDHSSNCLLPLSEQQPAEIRPTTIEVAWPVTAGLGVRSLTLLAIAANERAQQRRKEYKKVWKKGDTFSFLFSY